MDTDLLSQPSDFYVNDDANGTELVCSNKVNETTGINNESNEIELNINRKRNHKVKGNCKVEKKTY